MPHSSKTVNSRGEIRLKPRLAAAAHYVRKGSVCADVGTDHCYLPIYLIKSEIACRVIATDINIGPLKKAKESLEFCGVDERIVLRLADGLNGIENDKPDDILICGMGGELIRDIIDACEYTKHTGVNLILQPMTKSSALRKYLAENGYNIIDETLVEDDKIYEVIFCSYDGIKRKYTDFEYELGVLNIFKREEIFTKFLYRHLEIAKYRLEGKKSANLNVDDDINFINFIKSLIEENDVDK